MGLARALLLLIIITSCQTKNKLVTTKQLSSQTGALLQAISIVDETRAWVSGHQATFCRTTDRGDSWQVFKHASDTLQFRDIHAFDIDKVVLMSAGSGNASRIYLFDASKGLYKETYVMPHPQGFLNTIEFWDTQNGLAFGDSFNNEYFILKTSDGGNSWSRIDPTKLPKAGEGEGGFAASGTCITTLAGGVAHIGTGAGGHSNILSTDDFGETWSTQPGPLTKGDFAGIFSIRMTDELGLVAGGDFNQSDQYTENIATSRDEGKSWLVTTTPITRGVFYGSDLLALDDSHFLIVSGPNGVDYSWDAGAHWINLDTNNYWAVEIHPSGFGYASGTEGKILRIELD